MNCGGIDRELDPPTWQWSCTPLDPSADRGDGCPFALPESGSHCPIEGARCQYSDDPCGWDGTAATCAGGTWALAGYAHEPPP